jgi:hypothetical protein
VTGTLVTAEGVAELLGLPKSWADEQSRAGRIPTLTVGRPRHRAIQVGLPEQHTPGT